METKEGASYRGPGKGEGEMTDLEVLQYGVHIRIYAYACMESLYTSYTHKLIIIHRNSIVRIHIIMDPVPKDNLAIGAGKTAETIFSVDNTSDYIR